MTVKMPVYYLSHGGGPWPWIEERRESNTDLTQSLRHIPSELPQTPTAILMVSAHWESQEGFLIQGHPNPSMVYDYYNFPAHTYEVVYPAPGKPDLALQVQQLVQQAGFKAAIDPERGFDHGAFVPAFVMYPEAQMPIVQLSINANYDPAQHLALGAALKPLREQGVLIIGSGASYHNLRLLGPEGAMPSAEFDSWLEAALLNTKLAERAAHMKHWSQAPSARIVHAREDHLVPLFVSVGASSDVDQVSRILTTTSVHGIKNASYRFG